MSELPYVERHDLTSFLRSFLESSPLYRALRFQSPSDSIGSTFEWPDSITFDCRKCGHPTTWCRNSGDKDTVYLEGVARTETDHWLRFTCLLCRGVEPSAVGFWVQRSSSKDTSSKDTKANTHQFMVRKCGQYPAWSIAIPDKVRAALPVEALGFYQNGVICLSQRFGLAANAYFRRVVEEVLGVLMDLVEDTARSVGDQSALDVVAAARTSRQGSDKLKAIASAVPAALKVNGQNPLAMLYDAYSESIHAKTEDECEEVALRCRAILDYVLPGLHEQLSSAKAFTAAMTAATPTKPRTATAGR